MKTKTPLILTLAHWLMATSIFAQAPQKMSYQAVIRDVSNALVTSTAVGMQISILQGSANGTSVFVETQTPTSNANGLVSLEVGAGTVVSGTFAAINWANGPYFIKTETDPAGGTNYTITGTTQLLSVPYAMYAENGRSSVSNNGDTLFIGNQFYIIPGISGTNQSIGVSPLLMQHSCGAINVHNPNLNYGTMNDQDGNTYKTIIIGSQEWMAENLKTSHYRNGDLITTNLTDSMWGYAGGIGACCFFNNDSANYCCPYGKLYNWYAVSDTRNVCPVGWHIPDKYEGRQLIKYLDIYADTTITSFNSSLSVGGKLKNAGINYWMSPNTGANNASGFSALPGGERRLITGYGSLGYFGSYWTSSIDVTLPYFIQVNSSDGSSGVNRGSVAARGYSIRCIKD